MSHRIERVNTLLKREISELIQHTLRDPRLAGFVAITEVDTSPDLQFARVYVSSIGGQEEEEQVLVVLKGAAGFLRSELAKKVRLRRMPELIFKWDNSIEHGDRILRLMDQIEAEKDN
jgi:ribosome-binding factor A